MITTLFQFDSPMVQTLFGSVSCLLAAAGSHYLWLKRNPGRKLSTRPVRITRDYPPHRR